MRFSASSAAVLIALVAVSRAAAAEEADPYLWLEEWKSPKVMAWIEAENAKTLAVLEGDRRYAGFYRDALAIAEAKERIPTPSFLAGALFNFWQDVHHVRGVWRRTTAASYRDQHPHWQTVLDLDALAQSEKANWAWKGVDCAEPRELRCMVLLSDGGEDAVTLREFDLPSRHFLRAGFVLPRGKQRAAWQDDDTLLVSREWAPGEMTASGYPFIVKRWKRGQPLGAATEVFRGSAQDGGYGVSPLALHDGTGHQVLLILRPRSTFEAEYHLITTGGVKRLALPLKAQVEDFVSNQLLVSLAEDWSPSPGVHLAQGTLVAIDATAASADPAHLQPVVVYAPGPRESFQASLSTRDSLVVATLDNVQGRASVYQRKADGTWAQKPLPVPANASVQLVDGNLHGDEAFLELTGFLQPSSLVLANAATDALTPVKQLPAQFDASRDVVEQFEATSSDGTQVPYFVVHPVKMKLDGNNPTILYAYGGFQVIEAPSYSGVRGKLWLEQGGVFVLANIRGGGEFGPAWHEAGLKTHRQRIYDDFAAVARDLFARKITSPRRLGIVGGSNGGLLMGVEFTQHPELWRAVDIQVPLLDMLRFEKIAAGPSWVGEYGSVSVPEERAFLASISPYENLKRGVQYPEPFIWTTTKDDRVGPQHARKFAARLSELGIPYLFYEITEGGHGSGINLKETAKMSALEMTYFARKLMD